VLKLYKLAKKFGLVVTVVMAVTTVTGRLGGGFCDE